MHIYEKDGVYLPSVTTILHYVMIDGERLLKWSNSLGFRHIDYVKELDNRAAFGTAVHASLEILMTNKDAKIDVPGFDIFKLKKTIGNFKEFMKANELHPSDTLHAEMTIRNTELGYAGTCDWVGNFNGKLTLIDYKTSKKPNDTMYMQLAAYRKLLESEGIIIEQAGIITVNDSGVKLYMKTLGELDYYYEIFELIHSLFTKLMPYSKLEEEAKQLNNLITSERDD